MWTLLKTLPIPESLFKPESRNFLSYLCYINGFEEIHGIANELTVRLFCVTRWISKFKSPLAASFVSLVARVTKLGYFWKWLTRKSRTKVAQILRIFLGYFGNVIFRVKTALATFWATVGNILGTFYSYIWSHCW